MITKSFAYAAVVVALGAADAAMAASPTVWTTTIDPNVYGGATGTIKFNDWGYKGPTGVGANDYQVGAGFDPNRVGQIQHVVTKSPDYKTPDPAANIYAEFSTTKVYSNANMDGQVNFYQWAYTTPAGSTFNNMKIDKAGNYFVAKSDMKFGFYDVFEYRDTTGVNASQTVDTKINFQPYAISDAKGWCGSVLVSNPAGLSQMGGQVTFDFAFDAYLKNWKPGTTPQPTPATQIIPGFVMRSYGDYTVDVDAGGGDIQHYVGSAVMNNTNPLTGQLDPAYQNQVSFLGAGVVPDGAWVINDGTANVQVVAAGTPGAVWHSNSFAGYAFLLRADANRTLDFIALDGHSDYVSTDPAAYTGLAPVPVPAAVWLLGSGLFGLFAAGRRKFA